MSFVIISKELSSSKISHPEGVVIDFSNFDKCIEHLSNMTNEPISIYDITENQEFNHEEIIPINDQVNCTGTNPLVGRQQKLGIDFVDMTSIYKYTPEGVVTHSCGEKLNLQFEFPSYYLAHIVILARALRFESIGGWLINKNKGC
jgi:hypothetical protein